MSMKLPASSARLLSSFVREGARGRSASLGSPIVSAAPVSLASFGGSRGGNVVLGFMFRREKSIDVRRGIGGAAAPRSIHPSAVSPRHMTLIFPTTRVQPSSSRTYISWGYDKTELPKRELLARRRRRFWIVLSPRSSRITRV